MSIPAIFAWFNANPWSWPALLATLQGWQQWRQNGMPNGIWGLVMTILPGFLNPQNPPEEPEEEKEKTLLDRLADIASQLVRQGNHAEAAKVLAMCKSLCEPSPDAA